MTKTGTVSRQTGRRLRKPRAERQGSAIEEELNQTFHDLENEAVPQHLTRLAEKLDKAIDNVVRKKTN